VAGIGDHRVATPRPEASAWCKVVVGESGEHLGRGRREPRPRQLLDQPRCAVAAAGAQHRGDLRVAPGIDEVGQPGAVVTGDELHAVPTPVPQPGPLDRLQTAGAEPVEAALEPVG
jgi:hypothetical protein